MQCACGFSHCIQGNCILRRPCSSAWCFHQFSMWYSHCLPLVRFSLQYMNTNDPRLALSPVFLSLCFILFLFVRQFLWSCKELEPAWGCGRTLPHVTWDSVFRVSLLKQHVWLKWLQAAKICRNWSSSFASPFSKFVEFCESGTGKSLCNCSERDSPQQKSNGVNLASSLHR